MKDDMLEIFQHMYTEGGIQPSQTHGLIVCLPKHDNPVTTDDYRPLTLLNSDYKILARLIANRIRPWINDILYPCQHCGIGDNILTARRIGTHQYTCKIQGSTDATASEENRFTNCTFAGVIEPHDPMSEPTEQEYCTAVSGTSALIGVRLCIHHKPPS